MSIVLIGAPGAGKSSVGSQLASQCGMRFIDVDAVIEQRAGKSITEIFTEDGEAAFRAAEHSITLELLNQDAVIALGGGAILDPDIRVALGEHTVIWLEVSATKSSHRVGMNRTRPLLLGNIRARIVQLLKARTIYYQQLANYQIDTNTRTITEVVAEIQRVLP